MSTIWYNIKNSLDETTNYNDLPSDHIVKKVINRNYSGRYNINLLEPTAEEFADVYDWASEQENKSAMNTLSQVLKVAESPDTAIVTRLQPFLRGVVDIMKKERIRGWVYRINGKLLDAYLVKHVTIKEASGQDPQKVIMTLVAFNPRLKKENGLDSTSLYFTADDLKSKKTIGELFLDKGFFFENGALHGYHERNKEKYLELRKKHNDQFWFKGNISSRGYDTAIKTNAVATRAVNDESIFECPVVERTSSPFWEDLGYKDDSFHVPTHPYIYMYNLDRHLDFFGHVTLLEEYQYDKKVKEKLILPEEHKSLVDILVDDMDILQEDIVRGKSGGTTILCTGTPGLGKTLTAEVYSETVERPLYRVQSGQLGSNIGTIEDTLKSILDRASRWGAVLLIDEADVYIRQRDNSMTHNAIVATFLRTLEYFSGLLFLTTNRGDDVDDAIVSRCIAVIDYRTPVGEDAIKIWQVLSKQYGVDLSEQLISDLVDKYSTASGRDIKELLKLTSRYAKAKNLEYSVDVFQKMAQFRRF